MEKPKKLKSLSRTAKLIVCRLLDHRTGIIICPTTGKPIQPGTDYEWVNKVNMSGLGFGQYYKWMGYIYLSVRSISNSKQYINIYHEGTYKLYGRVFSEEILLEEQ